MKVTATTPEGNFTNAILDRWETAALQTVAHFKEYVNKPTDKELFEFLDRKFYRDEQSTTTLFLEYLENYIETRVEEGVKKKYVSALHKLQEYEEFTKEKLRFIDIDIDFYNKFKKWFYEKGFSANYFGNMIRVIKKAYNDARDVDGLHSHNKLRKGEFVAPDLETDNIYLSDEELEKIKNLEITFESIRRLFPDLNDTFVQRKVDSMLLIRNRFLIGAYTGLRVSDFSVIGSINVKGGFIRKKTKKTEENVVIPIHPVVEDILSSGFDLSKRVSDQKINEHIKEIARLAGIKEKVLIHRNEGGKNREYIFEKCDLVCTHTARRSFATNLYLAGVPIPSIMKLTGHKTISSFLKYIKVDKQQNAEILKENKYFKRKIVGANVEPNVNQLPNVEPK